MVYVMSDLHGEYEKYMSMIEKIKFSNNDLLFILGDVVDRGPDPLKILYDMSMRSNVFPILGNHEIAALAIIKPLLAEITEHNYNTQITSVFLNSLIEYQANGGNTTLDNFKALSVDKRAEMVEYLEEFVPFEIVETNNKTFVLVHSGLGNYQKDKKLVDYTLDELCFSRPDYNNGVFDGTNHYIVCGHTPTLAISGRSSIIRQNHYINIDCGACFPGGRLACLCLDNMQEFYV